MVRKGALAAAGGAALGVTALLVAGAMSPDGREAIGRLVRRPRAEMEPSALDDAAPATEVPKPSFHDVLADLSELAHRVASGEATGVELIHALVSVKDQGGDFVAATRTTGGGRRWRHLKRDTTYAEVGRATLHFMFGPPVEGDTLCVVNNGLGLLAVASDLASNVDGTMVMEVDLQVSTRPLVSGDTLVVYRADVGGKGYARLREEFLDGRFERLPDVAAQA